MPGAVDMFLLFCDPVWCRCFVVFSSFFGVWSETVGYLMVRKPQNCWNNVSEVPD